MASVYPGAYDDFPDVSNTDQLNTPGKVHSTLHTDIGKAIENIQAELGLNPSDGASSYATVKARLAAIDSTISSHTHTATQISNSTTVGRAVLTAASESAARTAIGITGSGTIAIPRTGRLIVASNNAAAEVKDQADFVCNGTNDQVEINAALLKASRPGDGFGGEGYIGVELAGPYFSIGDNNTGTIKMYPSTSIWGQGWGTQLMPKYTTGSDLGCFELINAAAKHCSIMQLTIGDTAYNRFNGHGIKIVSNESQTYEIQTGADAYVTIANVNIQHSRDRGIWLLPENSGTDIAPRAVQIRDCIITNSIREALYIQSGATDARIDNCTFTGASGTTSGVRVAAGNTKIGGCKVFYRGNSSGGSAQHGFEITGGRVSLIDCEAQDNGGYGFYITGDDTTMSGCGADANSAKSSSMGGFYIGGDGSYAGLNTMNYTPGHNDFNQLKAFQFANSAQVMLTGRANVPSGSNHVSGSPGADSFVRIVCNGAAVYTG